MTPSFRPRLRHCPAKNIRTGAGVLPAIRRRIVAAAAGPSCTAAWQLIRNGRSVIAAASPAATMRTSSTLVSVASVSRRPSVSVRSPLRAARSGTRNPAVQIVTALGSSRPSSSCTASRVTSLTRARGPSRTVTPSLASRRATGRRTPGMQGGAEHVAADQGDPAARFRQLGGGLQAGRAGPDHGHRSRAGAAASADRSRSAPSRSDTGWANSAAPGTPGSRRRCPPRRRGSRRRPCRRPPATPGARQRRSG